MPHVYKTFQSKADATRYAQESELKIQKGIFDDMTEAHQTSLKDALVRYRDEITPNKKGAKQEAYKIDKLMRHKISNYSLARLTSNKIAKLKNQLAVTSAPATVNKYLTLISVALNTAKNKWDIFLFTNVCSNLKRLAEPEVKDTRLEPAESSFKFNGNCLCLVISY